MRSFLSLTKDCFGVQQRTLFLSVFECLHHEVKQLLAGTILKIPPLMVL